MHPNLASTVTVLLIAAAVGLGLVIGGFAALRLSGAQPGLARRLAGPREVAVGRLLDPDEPLPERPVRIAGRIRCPDALRLADGQLAIAFHRDVEVRGPGGWRSLERLRESRSFELWDHRGSLWLDPGLAADPLIAIPAVWRGSAADLREPHASSARRLEQRIGPLREARATTRTIDITDRLLVVAVPQRLAGGGVALAPPFGGYLVSNLALGDAMRLLGGRHRRVAVVAVVGIALGVALLAVGGVGAGMAALLGA
jgi:hypothetical protein